MHTLISTATNGKTASWRCSCGTTGQTSRAFEGEDLEAKATWNHAQHARTEARKEQR